MVYEIDLAGFKDVKSINTSFTGTIVIDTSKGARYILGSPGGVFDYRPIVGISSISLPKNCLARARIKQCKKGARLKLECPKISGEDQSHTSSGIVTKIQVKKG